FVEIVDVDTVLRGGHALGLRLQIAHGIGESPGARFAHDEHVVTGPAHGDPEMHRLHGAVLPEDALEGLKIIRGREPQTVEVDRYGQLFWRQQCRAGFAHQTSLVEQVKSQCKPSSGLAPPNSRTSSRTSGFMKKLLGGMRSTRSPRSSSSPATTGPTAAIRSPPRISRNRDSPTVRLPIWNSRRTWVPLVKAMASRRPLAISAISWSPRAPSASSA